jgi:hypothetical protein
MQAVPAGIWEQAGQGGEERGRGRVGLSVVLRVILVGTIAETVIRNTVKA